mmetsp:Transcript_28854/g.71219  ORF Transcript_28854/g.71219 Transcript_28854/m.71219 type:complete len:267 (+) Transcript_28854:1328-2128(+)
MRRIATCGNTSSPHPSPRRSSTITSSVSFSLVAAAAAAAAGTGIRVVGARHCCSAADAKGLPIAKVAEYRGAGEVPGAAAAAPYGARPGRPRCCGSCSTGCTCCCESDAMNDLSDPLAFALFSGCGACCGACASSTPPPQLTPPAASAFQLARMARCRWGVPARWCAADDAPSGSDAGEDEEEEDDTPAPVLRAFLDESEVGARRGATEPEASARPETPAPPLSFDPPVPLPTTHRDARLPRRTPVHATSTVAVEAIADPRTIFKG